MGRYRAALTLGVVCALIGLAGAQSEQARQLWQHGQNALHNGQPERAIGFYEESLRVDPALAQNHLGLASAFLETGDDVKACLHLARYLDAHPDQHMIRSHYAEVLLRIGRFELARLELTRLLHATEDKDAYVAQQINAHQLLMEIALADEDTYHARLHRGIGLFLLSQQIAKHPDPQGELSVEGLLFKAAGELSAARSLDRTMARPCWYLYRAWSKLGQSNQAKRFLHEAHDRAACNDLTPAELQLLLLTH